MSITQRLKNSPWLHWAYIVFYVVISALPIVIGTVVDNSPYALDKDFVTVFAVGSVVISFLMYPMRIARTMLSDNFIIKNHRHTPMLLSIIIGMFALMLFSIRMFVFPFIGLAVIYLIAALFVISIVFYVYKFYIEGASHETDKAKRLITLGIMVLLFGVLQYNIVSLLLVNYGGISLVVLGVGVVGGAMFFAYGFIEGKKQPKQAANMESLTARFEVYLKSVFDKLPLTDNLITLKEQLKSNLLLFAEKSLDTGLSENTIYIRAIDSLGDYSELLYPYRRNIFARFAGSINKRANLLFYSVFQMMLVMLFFGYLQEDDWTTGSFKFFTESYPYLIFFAFAGIGALAGLRVVENIRAKNHMLTPLFVGIIILMLLLISAMRYGLEIYSMPGITLEFGYAIAALVLVTAAIQTSVFIVVKKNKSAK